MAPLRRTEELDEEGRVRMGARSRRRERGESREQEECRRHTGPNQNFAIRSNRTAYSSSKIQFAHSD